MTLSSCSADPDKRVHSISVMDPGFPVCVCVCVWGGGGGEQLTHAHILLQLGYVHGGVTVSSSIGSKEEHIILYFNINLFQRVYGKIKPIT